MPGTRLMEFARRWFPPSIVASVFEPLVADWQRQSSETTGIDRSWGNAKGFCAFATTALLMAPRLVLQPGMFRARPLAAAGGFWLMASAILLVPAIREQLPLNLLWLLLPGCLTLMLPFAVIPAIDAMRRDDEEPTAADRRGALVLVVVAVCGVAIGQGWLSPAANQQFRNMTSSEQMGRYVTVTRGVRELTTLELIAGGGSSLPVLSERTRLREINMRLALAVLPAVLAWLRWRSLSRLRKRSWPVVRSCLLAIAATAAFVAVMPTGPALEHVFLAPGFGPTLALVLFALTTRTGIWLRQRVV